MRAAAALIATLALMLAPLHARAEGAPVTHDGKPGVWFGVEAAKRLLKDVTELKSIRQQLHVLEQLIAVRKEREALLKGVIADTEKLVALWKKTAETQTATLEKVTDPPFYKKPVFWFAVGFAVAAGLSIGLAAGLTRSSTP